jgi:hypothetical protein
MSVRLGVVVPTLSSNAAEIRHRLGTWRKSFIENGVRPHFIVVVQTPGAPDVKIAEPDVTVQVTPTRSVSHARNLGMYSVTDDYVLFLDDDVQLTPSFVQFISSQIGKASMLAGRLTWNRWLRQRGMVHYTNCVYLNLFAVVFDCAAIRAHQLQFDESFGLGDGIRWKSGEDALFLFHYLTATKSRSFLFNPDALVDHPPRNLTEERQKIIDYALGQGRTWKHLVAAAPNWGISLYLRVLFAGTLASNLVRIPSQPGLRTRAFANRLVGYFHG